MSLQFDVIVGNPPYQNSSGSKKTGLPGSSKNLYLKFITLAVDLLKDGGELVYVCPPGYLKTTAINTKSDTLELFQKYNLSYLDFDCKKYFPEVSLSSITSFILKKNTDYTTTEVITEDGIENIDLARRDFIPLNCTEQLIDKIDSLISPIPTLSFKRDDSHKILNHCKNTKTNYVVVSQISASKLEVKVNDVILNNKNKIKPFHIMKCDSVEHANEVCDILVSDKATLVNSTLRYGDANVYPRIINHIK